MSIEKMYCNESKKSLSQQLLFQVSLFKSDFVSTLPYLDCHYYEYPVNQTTLLYLNLLLKPALVSVFLLFLKR